MVFPPCTAVPTFLIFLSRQKHSTAGGCCSDVKRKKVLIIEDENDIAAIVTFFLEKQGYQVWHLSDALGFEEKLKTLQPDVVLLDLNIAGFNGKIICDYLKGNPGLRHIAVILMSANTDILHIKNECGADSLIKKPFDLRALLAEVAQYTN